MPRSCAHLCVVSHYGMISVPPRETPQQEDERLRGRILESECPVFHANDDNSLSGIRTGKENKKDRNEFTAHPLGDGCAGDEVMIISVRC